MKALVAYVLLSCVLMTGGAQARGAGVTAAVVTAAVPLKEGMTALQARQALSKNKWIANPSKHSREVEMWGLLHIPLKTTSCSNRNPTNSSN